MMKRFAIYTFLLLIFVACADKKESGPQYTISGKLDKGEQTLHLYGWDSRYETHDSVICDKNGNFSISIPADTIIPLALHMPEGGIVTLYAEPGLHATLHKDSAISCGWSVKGGSMQALHDSISRILDSKSSYNSRLAVIDSFIKYHPTNEVSIMMLRRYIIEIPEPDNVHIRNRLGKLSGNLQDHEFIVSTNRLVNQDHSNILHKSFPAFEYKTADGSSVSQTDCIKKYTLITFWASWDEKSRNGMRELRALRDSIDSPTFNILNISLDHDTVAWREFIEGDSIVGTNVCDTKGFNSALLKKFNVKSLPFTMLVTPYQRITRYGLEIGNCAREIDEIVTKYDKEEKEKAKAKKK